MRAADWVARLESRLGALEDARGRRLVREVRGAASLAAAAAEPDRLTDNRIFVAPAGETSTGANGAAQVTQREMLVVLALRDPSDALGGDGLTDLERAVDAATRALIGWRPDGAAGAVVFLRGALFDFRRQSLWWQMTFAAPVVVRGG